MTFRTTWFATGSNGSRRVGGRQNGSSVSQRLYPAKATIRDLMLTAWKLPLAANQRRQDRLRCT